MSDSNEHSRQILSYWTAQRMRAAEPEPNIEFTELEDEVAIIDIVLSHSQAILDYWTPERQAAALPEEPAYDHHPSVENIHYYTEKMKNPFISHVPVAGPLQIVSDAKVQTFPYQSVGKLFYTKVTPSGSSRDSHASAYVVEHPTVGNTIYTAAHCLKRGNETAKNILFIPGLIPPNTEHFGRYPQVPGGEGSAWFVDPQWDPNNIQAKHDKGRIILDKNPITGKNVDEIVGRIQILNDTSTPEWNSIGFPVPSSGNPLGKMAERWGAFKAKQFGCVYKAGVMPPAASGGPWIFSDKSNGTQVGNKDNAMSPYFE